MTVYNIRNQEDFNKVYANAPTKERGKLGYAFPEYYQNYINTNTQTIDQWLNRVKDKAEREVNEALKKDLREENLKAISGRENKYWTPLKNQEERDKYANYLKQQKAQKSSKTYSKDDIKLLIANEARRQGVDPRLALAVAQHESGFNPNAKGDGGKSYGLFQIYTTAHPDYTGGFDPQKNAEYGIRFLKGLLNRYNGDVRTALRAYNGGHGGINLAQTAKYADSVLGIYNNTQDIKDLPDAVPTNQQPVKSPSINMGDFINMLDNTYSTQNAQEGALNNFQDIQYLNQIQPGLTRQRIASELESLNPSKQYLDIARQGYKNTYDLASQASGYGLEPKQQEIKEDMMNYNNGMAPVPNSQEYPDIINTMRPYAQINNQPQNIREDVLADYMKLIDSLRQQNVNQNQALFNQYEEARKADERQNLANQLVNSFGVFGQPETKAPIYYIGAKGDMRKVELDQPGKVQPLPTNISSNIDNFKNQLAFQLKTQQSNKDMLDAFKSAISAQQMSEVTGLPSGVFLDPDLYKTYAQYIQNPEIAQRAQFKREAGMAPINLSSDLSKQALVNAGDLDVANLKAQADLGKAGVAGEYQLKNTALQNAMSGANQFRTAMLNAQTQQSINRANNIAKYTIANMDNETKLEIARQAGANAQDLAILQDSLYSNNPVRIQNANAQLSNAMANLMILSDNPEMGFDLYKRIINMNNPTQSSSGTLTEDVWDE